MMSSFNRIFVVVVAAFVVVVGWGSARGGPAPAPVVAVVPPAAGAGGGPNGGGPNGGGPDGGGPVVRTAQPVYSTLTATLRITGAQPDTRVRVYLSRTGFGAGPCQGGHCLDILPPATLLGAVTADSAGEAALAVVFDEPEDVQLYLQPVQVAPAVVGAVAPVTVWERPRVVMIGDSITEGGQSQPTAYQYTTVAGGLLGRGVEVIEAGCGGATSADWSTLGQVTLCGGQFWEPDVYSVLARPHLPAALATVMLGTNDATGFFEPQPIPPDQYRSNMEALVGQLLQDGAEQVLLLTPPPMCATTHPDVVARLEGYRVELAEMCASMAQVVCGPDVYTLLEPDDFQGCDVHPNGLGHLDIGVALADAVRAALEE